MNWNGKKVLVTGACGFIGSHLVEKLVTLGADVRAFVYYNSFNTWGWIDSLPGDIKKEIDVFTGDIRDPYCVRKSMEGRDNVFHLAALIAIPYSYVSPHSYVETNVTGTLNVLQAALDYGVQKIVHTSTSEVYGTAKTVPITEEHTLQGQSPYSASKIGADMIAESFYRSFNAPVVIARPFNTYGPRQSARAVIPTLITQMLSGAKSIKVGSLHPTRDFTYVEDTAQGFIKLAEAEGAVGTVTNIGSNSEISIGQLIEKLKLMIKSDAEIVTESQRVRPEKSEVERLRASNDKLFGLTGWRPQITLDDGLMRSIEWMKSNIKRYKPDMYNI